MRRRVALGTIVLASISMSFGSMSLGSSGAPASGASTPRDLTPPRISLSSGWPRRKPSSAPTTHQTGAGLPFDGRPRSALERKVERSLQSLLSSASGRLASRSKPWPASWIGSDGTRGSSPAR
jgi:hypothetical protein